MMRRSWHSLLGVLLLAAVLPVPTARSGDRNHGFRVGEIQGAAPTDEPTSTPTPLPLESLADYPLGTTPQMGVHWVTTTPLYARTTGGSNYLSFQGYLWKIAGKVGGDNDGSFPSNRIMRSKNGWDWEPVGVRSIFSKRIGSAAAVFNDRMWVIGGNPSGAWNAVKYLGDIWSSADGVDWVCALPEAAFGRRTNVSCAVFKGRLWVVGGRTEHGCAGDAWSTSDGVNWKLEVRKAPFAPRNDASLLVHGERMYLCGGKGDKYYFLTDLWSSADGKVWIKETDEVGVPDGLEGGDPHVAVSFAGKIWYLTSQKSAMGGAKQLRCSVDGKTWENRVVSGATLSFLSERAVVHEGKLYVFGDGLGVTADGKNWTRQNVDRTFWGSYHWAHPTMVEFLGRLWVFGGGEGTTRGNALWSSPDGWTWKEVTAELPKGFTGRLEAAVVNGSLWVTNRRMGLLWSTRDGIHWAKVADSGNLPKCERGAFAGFQGKIWLIGGKSQNSEAGKETAEVWSSENGKGWKLETDQASFGLRSDLTVVEHNDQLWVLGGYYHDDIWKSRDGKTWTRVAEQAPFQMESEGIPAVSCGGSLWVYPGGDYQGIWSSQDGAHWSNARRYPPLPKRIMHALASFQGRLVAFGGYNGNNYADLWFSPTAPSQSTTSIPTPKPTAQGKDALRWDRVIDKTPFSQMKGPLVSAWDRLWMVGGMRPGLTSTNEVWSSADGVEWKEEIHDPPFTQRFGHMVVFFQNRLWVLGGRDPWGARDDVWVSDDGRHWEQVVEHAGFTPLERRSCLVFKEKLYVLGGDSLKRGVVTDIWSSPDGVRWTKVADQPEFGDREMAAFYIFKDKMYVMGGRGSDGSLQDVWSSSDGGKWTQRKVSPPLPRASRQNIIAYRGKLWMLGGELQGLWTSDNGTAWTQVETATAFGNTTWASLAVLKDRLYLYGVDAPNELWRLGPALDTVPE